MLERGPGVPCGFTLWLSKVFPPNLVTSMGHVHGPCALCVIACMNRREPQSYRCNTVKTGRLPPPYFWYPTVSGHFAD